MRDEYVQFGCGLCAPPTWRNFDAGPAFWLQKRLPLLRPMLLRRGFPDYPTARIEYGDVVKGLPVAPQSARAVYCSHVLEHLALDEFRATVRNVFGYLKPGGTFRLVVPDLEAYAKEYVADSGSEPASTFMEKSLLGEKHHARGLKALPQSLFGRSRHLWMWDYRTMVSELAAAGFVNFRRAQFGDGADPLFLDVESADRWKNNLGVDCSRA